MSFWIYCSKDTIYFHDQRFWMIFKIVIIWLKSLKKDIKLLASDCLKENPIIMSKKKELPRTTTISLSILVYFIQIEMGISRFL